ncbi:unnamed protein product [Coffea canephora]|uniref:DH200=94 genomic scaffold, scaffold_1397 n=1 Tax=Coffea canephora TaxID=49390 RepID=A0A068VLN0_COFCA|nr:unnamed protein product [Coffea canephora]
MSYFRWGCSVPIRRPITINSPNISTSRVDSNATSSTCLLLAQQMGKNVNLLNNFSIICPKISTRFCKPRIQPIYRPKFTISF